MILFILMFIQFVLIIPISLACANINREPYLELRLPQRYIVDLKLPRMYFDVSSTQVIFL